MWLFRLEYIVLHNITQVSSRHIYGRRGEKQLYRDSMRISMYIYIENANIQRGKYTWTYTYIDRDGDGHIQTK